MRSFKIPHQSNFHSDHQYTDCRCRSCMIVSKTIGHGAVPWQSASYINRRKESVHSLFSYHTIYLQKSYEKIFLKLLLLHIYNNLICIKRSYRTNMFTSKIYSISDEQFHEIIKKNHTYSGCLRDLGLGTKGGNSTLLLKKRIKELNCDISHFTFHSLGNNECVSRIPLEDILVENSTYTNRQRLKIRLINANLLEYKCCECGLKNKWNGKELVLQLHHKNGIETDNRLENLGFLCPNCHSQTPTFSGKNATSKAKKNYCIDCGKEIHRNSTRCHKCNNKLYKHKKGQKLGHKINENLVVDTYNRVQNVTQTAKALHCNKKTVSDILKENNVPIIPATTIAKNKGFKVNMLSKDNELLNSFDTLMDAARYISQTSNSTRIKNVSCSISNVCKGKRKSAYGYKWEYATPEKEDTSNA